MKCCLCEEVNFDVIMELHRPLEELPNLVCDGCMINISESCWGSSNLSDLTYEAVRQKENKEGKRCK